MPATTRLPQPAIPARTSRVAPLVCLLLVATLTPRLLASEDRLLGPSFGRPSFVAPGGTLTVHALLETPPSRLAIRLQRPSQPGIPLETPAEALGHMQQGRPFQLVIPPGTPPGTYDLEILADQRLLQARHCVRVWQPQTALRIVHLGPPGPSGRYPDELLQQIELLAPTALLVNADHPQLEPLVAQLQRMSMPAILSAGPATPGEVYGRLVSASPVGLVRIGAHRILVVHDQPEAPLLRDTAQREWLEAQLAQPAQQGLTLLLSSAAQPALLRSWLARGTLRAWLRRGHIGLWLGAAGGGLDPQLVQELGPTRALQTAAGQFQVLDLSPHSLTWLGGEAFPPGSVQLERGRPDDHGTAFALTNRNRHDVPGVTFWLGVQGSGDPWCLGADIVERVRTSEGWLCRLRSNLPPAAPLRGWLGTGARPIEPLVETPGPLDDGMLPIRIRNPGSRRVVIRPEVRYRGNTLELTDAAGRPLPVDYPIPVAPGATARLRVICPPGIVEDSRGTLQVYLHGRPVLVPQQVPIPQ